MPTFHGSRSDLIARLHSLAAALAGTGPPDPLAPAVLTRGAVALLAQVQAAYIVKARGGVGADGIRWTPLKRATIAARPVTPGELKKLGAGGKRTRGLLTPEEDKRWRAIFAKTLARLRARGQDEEGAKGIAARTAWAALKASGAKTKLEVLGGRNVEIGRSTGALLRSLEPGYGDQPSGAENQIFETQPGRLTVGSKLVYAGRFHAARPLWPADGPSEKQMDAVGAAILRGMQAAVEQAVAGG